MKKGLRILVCGGRDFDKEDFLFGFLDGYLYEVDIDCIIHGNANGADRLADYWATTRGHKVDKYPADWKKHGRAAGPIRNKQMIDEGKPDVVIAFPGGKGTANMIKQAIQNNIECIKVVDNVLQ